jgi:hypothetical protein
MVNAIMYTCRKTSSISKQLFWAIRTDINFLQQRLEMYLFFELEFLLSKVSFAQYEKKKNNEKDL